VFCVNVQSLVQLLR